MALAVARCAPPLSLKSSGKGDAKKAEDVTVTFEAPGVDGAAVTRLQAVADAIRAAQLLADSPPCRLDAETFEAFAREQVEGLPGVSVTTICGKELEAMGMGGLYGVGKAAAAAPRLLLLSHNGGGSGEGSSVCLAGKGIVYDTGGLSIKSTAGMCGMKVSMSLTPPWAQTRRQICLRPNSLQPPCSCVVVGTGPRCALIHAWHGNSIQNGQKTCCCASAFCQMCAQEAASCICTALCLMSRPVILQCTCMWRAAGMVAAVAHTLAPARVYPAGADVQTNSHARAWTPPAVLSP